MIISYSQKFIFLHSRKTAGSSISVALARQFGPDDIMLGCWSDAIKLGVRPNLASRSLAAKAARFGKFDPTLWPAGDRFPDRFNAAVKRYFRTSQHFEAGAHSSAAQIKAYAKDYWNEAFKFSFVRNPWDHAASDYYWRGAHTKGISFKDFLGRMIDLSVPDPEKVRPPLQSNWTVYTINDEVVADYIGRYETLSEDLEHISARIGQRIDISSVRAKSQVRANRETASLYDDDCVEMVRQIYKNEIETFGYAVPF